MTNIPVHVVGDEQKKAKSAHRLLEEGNFDEAVKILKSIERDDQLFKRLGLVPRSIGIR